MATNVPTTGDLLEVPSGVARLRYFHGQLLTQRDLQAEQRYHLLLQRLMQRETLGTGTVAGLRVDEAGASLPKNVYVRAGLALDPDGRELILVNDGCVTIAEPPLVAASHAAPGSDTSADIADWLTDLWADEGITVTVTADNIEDLSEKLISAGLTGDSDTNYPTTAAQLRKLPIPTTAPAPEGPETLADYLFDALVGKTHIGLRYVERGREPSPALLDGSCCGEAACFPSRTEEGVMIVAANTAFPAIVDPYLQAREFLVECLDEQEVAMGEDFDTFEAVRHCLAAYVTNVMPATFRGLPPADGVCGPPAPPVLPLALAYWSRFDVTGESRILSVDNAGIRQIALSAQTFRGLFEAITIASK